MGSAPDSEILTAITAICAELLQNDDISGKDNFFMLGGTSLNVIELADQLMEKYGLEVSLDSIFSADTLADLATHCKPAPVA